VITSADGQVQEVRGRGVIGLFPVMEPGAYFEYESCCPQPAPRGTMKGSFTMVRTAFLKEPPNSLFLKWRWVGNARPAGVPRLARGVRGGGA
jgi:hypothetical protein